MGSNPGYLLKSYLLSKMLFRSNENWFVVTYISLEMLSTFPFIFFFFPLCNVCFKKTGTKRSNNTLLRFVPVFLKQTLPGHWGICHFHIGLDFQYTHQYLCRWYHLHQRIHRHKCIENRHFGWYTWKWQYIFSLKSPLMLYSKIQKNIQTTFFSGEQKLYE